MLLKYITARAAMLFVFVLNSSKRFKLWASHTHRKRKEVYVIVVSIDDGFVPA